MKEHLTKIEHYTKNDSKNNKPYLTVAILVIVGLMVIDKIYDLTDFKNQSESKEYSLNLSYKVNQKIEPNQ